MKNISKFQITILTCSGLFLTNCHPHSKNMIAESYLGFKTEIFSVQNNEIATAQRDTYSDFQKFIKEAYSQLDQNEMTILKLERESDEVNEDLKVNDRSEFDNLKTSHNSLKSQLDEYVKNGSGNWHTFETEFCSGLNELEIASNSPLIRTTNQDSQ